MLRRRLVRRLREPCRPAFRHTYTTAKPLHWRPMIVNKPFFPRQVVESTGNRWDWALLPLVLAILFALAYARLADDAPVRSRRGAAADARPVDAAVLPACARRCACSSRSARRCSSAAFSRPSPPSTAPPRTCHGADARHPAVDPDPRLPVDHRHRLHRAVSRAICSASSARRSSPSSRRRPGTWRSACTSRCAPCPTELQEAARVFQLSGWQRFWRLEPAVRDAGTALEHDDVDVRRLVLRGRRPRRSRCRTRTSSCPASAPTSRWPSRRATCGAIGWAIGGMLIGILLYDQLFFRPLIAWADKFRFEEGSGDAAPTSWLLTWWRRTERTQRLGQACRRAARALLDAVPASVRRHVDPRPRRSRASRARRARRRRGAGRRRAATPSVVADRLHPRRGRRWARSCTCSCWAATRCCACSC